jgi:hypothetical protein
MFKNEAWIIKEWIEHYLKEGVEHFYLIDNGSTDDYEEKISDYINYITLVKDSTRLPYGTQSHLYQKIFLDLIKRETKWIITCDIDEYIYARNGYKTIVDVLDRLPSTIETIWIPWKIFGANGNIKHPNSVVANFTKRSDVPDKFLGSGKSIFQTKNLLNFGCCGHYVELKDNTRIHTPNGDNYYLFNMTEENCSKFNLHLNHYMFLSEEYYLKIKCSRGGGESGLIGKYSIDFFRENEKKHNKVLDDELLRKKSNFNKKNLVDSKYLNNASYLLIISDNSDKLLFQSLLNPNLKNIILIENNYDKFNNNNDIMINKTNFIQLFYEKSDMNWIEILNKDILSNIDLIYVDRDKDLHCILKRLKKYVSNKCTIITN